MSDQGSRSVGFVGLGSMGGVLASNLVGSGYDVVVYDKAGTAARAPEGARVASSVPALAEESSAIVLSLPDGGAVATVAEEIASADHGSVRHVIDTSTVGLRTAAEVHRLFAGHGISYVDAPVSGGVAAATARTIAIMFSGPDEAFEELRPLLEGLSDRCFRVGAEPGLGQALKLANNFLSATALLATSEAVAFGESVGLDIGVMLEVLNSSSGRNSATADKFPKQVVTGSYAAGFTSTLMDKDLGLYLSAIADVCSPSAVGERTASLWHLFATELPGVDFTRVYPFIRDRSQ